jgi:hypothetical protein
MAFSDAPYSYNQAAGRCQCKLTGGGSYNIPGVSSEGINALVCAGCGLTSNSVMGYFFHTAGTSATAPVFLLFNGRRSGQP